MVVMASAATDDQIVVIMPLLDDIQAKIKVFSPEAGNTGSERNLFYLREMFKKAHLNRMRFFCLYLC
jgi:hypothetical protein